MKRYILRGIAEGMVGQSQVSARSVKHLLEKFPELKAISSKIHIKGDLISGYAACDG